MAGYTAMAYSSYGRLYSHGLLKLWQDYGYWYKDFFLPMDAPICAKLLANG